MAIHDRSRPVRAPTPVSEFARPAFEREQRALNSEVVDVIREYELCLQHCFSGNCSVSAMRILESSPEELWLEVRMRCEDELFTVSAFMRRSGERWVFEK